jgi:flavorubredoxin
MSIRNRLEHIEEHLNYKLNELDVKLNAYDFLITQSSSLSINSHIINMRSEKLIDTGEDEFEKEMRRIHRDFTD